MDDNYLTMYAQSLARINPVQHEFMRKRKEDYLMKRALEQFSASTE